MRITTTKHYFHEVCLLETCERRYCPEHRLLYRDCDTSMLSWDGDADLIDGLRGVVELGDCPMCEKST